jgi:hypothetical protein
VLFRRPAWADADYHAWSDRVLADQVALCVPTTGKGETVARAVFLNPRCPPEFIDELLATMA